MSKKLIKILTFSALALIIPVAIIVTAICLSTAVSYSLTIDTKGFEDVGSVSIRVNGVEYLEPVFVSRNSEVTVSISTVGYDFKGWFEGDAKGISENDKAINEKATYSFTITEDTVITANNEIINYTVTYGEEEPVKVKYGSALKVQEDQDVENGIIFYGWTKEGSDKVYNTADFAEREVALVAKQDKIKYQVSYDGAEAVELVWGDALKADGINDRENGKVFAGWVIGEGTEVVSEAKFGKTFEVINLNSTLKTMVYSTISYSDATAVTTDVAYGSNLPVLENKDNGEIFKGWKRAEDETVYTTAVFNVEDETQEIVLTPYFKNIYETEETYKSVKVEWDYNSVEVEGGYIAPDELYYESDLVDWLESSYSKINIKIDAETETVDNNIYEITVADMISDVPEVVYDENGNEYKLDNIYVVYGNGLNQKAVKSSAVTLAELIAEYEEVSGTDFVFGDEVVVTITVSYAKA